MGGETVVGIYFMRNESIFNQSNRRNPRLIFMQIREPDTRNGYLENYKFLRILSYHFENIFALIVDF